MFAFDVTEKTHKIKFKGQEIPINPVSDFLYCRAHGSASRQGGLLHGAGQSLPGVPDGRSDV